MNNAAPETAEDRSPLPPPIGLLAELTHRCPLQCAYCSNPLQLERPETELRTHDWLDVFAQARRLGVLQVHLSGGEPAARPDLTALIRGAFETGLYTNLITSAVTLTSQRVAELASAGLDHVQISIQGVDRQRADRMAHLDGALAKKLAVAGAVREAGLALTINAPMHRQNLDELDAIIALAVEVGAHRLEVAHVQYYGFALANRAALMPTQEQVRRSIDIVAAARERLAGELVIDFVAPDYFARRPKPCMGGWGRRIITVTPSGRVLPCHAATSIPGLFFDNVRNQPLSWIWSQSASFNAFRGDSWMAAPCRSCERRAIDFGGCRCQAYALTGDATATDPACALSPQHFRIEALATANVALGTVAETSRRFPRSR
jgi:pyrroloquinoline quinone biosynthesis protein E